MARLIPILHLIVVIIAIIDISKSNKAQDKKILWIIIVFLFPLLGALLWYTVGKNNQ
jgi:hypothetical protein